MNRIIITLSAAITLIFGMALCQELSAQHLTNPPPGLTGYCYYAAGNYYLPIATSNGASFSLPNPPPASLIFGNYAAGPNYQPLQCDSSGKLIISGGGSFTALTGDATSTATGGATTVLGLKGVPFCTGYTPTNGQAVTLTTASSPNPCYTAAALGGGVNSFNTRTGAVTLSAADVNAVGAITNATSGNAATATALVNPLASCRVVTPITNGTGGTSVLPFTAASCPIPAGTLGANSYIEITATFGASSGGGTCFPFIYIDSTQNALTGGRNFGQGGNIAVAQRFNGSINNQASVSAQFSFGVMAGQGTIQAPNQVATTINTSTTAFYIDYGATPSTTATACTLENAFVVVTP